MPAFAAGFLVAMAFGVCLLVLSEREKIPSSLSRRYIKGTKFHATSARQILLEDSLRLGVVEDAIERLKKAEPCSAYIVGLEVLRSRLLNGWLRECDDVENAIGAGREYIFSNDDAVGYVRSEWVENLISTRVEVETAPEGD